MQTLTILFVVLFILTFAGLFLGMVLEDSGRVVVGILTIVILWIFTLIASTFISDGKFSYRQGQIDYHNGIIKYELKMQPDSTVKWEEVKK